MSSVATDFVTRLYILGRKNFEDVSSILKTNGITIHFVKVAECSRWREGDFARHEVPSQQNLMPEQPVTQLYFAPFLRFTKDQVCHSYLGLVPCQDQSGNSNRLGHITREGPAAVRRMLCEASWQAIRRSPTARRYFQRIQQGKKDRKKIALVATAHYLARVMLAMLRTGQAWRETELKQAA